MYTYVMFDDIILLYKYLQDDGLSKFYLIAGLVRDVHIKMVLFWEKE